MYPLSNFRFIIPVYTPCAHIPSRAPPILIVRMYQIGSEMAKIGLVVYTINPRLIAHFHREAFMHAKLIAFPRLTLSEWILSA